MVNVAVGEVVDPIVAKVIVSIAEQEREREDGRCEEVAPPPAKVTTEVMEDTRVMAGTSRGHSLHSHRPNDQMGIEAKAPPRAPNTTNINRIIPLIIAGRGRWVAEEIIRGWEACRREAVAAYNKRIT